MCNPTLAVSAGLQGGSMLANRRAQSKVFAQQAEDIREQAAFNQETFDERTQVVEDSDALIRKLEAQGFDRADAAQQVYTERMGDILEKQAGIDKGVYGAYDLQAERNSLLRATQSALVGDALAAANFAGFTANANAVEQALNDETMVASKPAAPSKTLHPAVQREMLRQNAEDEAEMMARESAGNRLAGASLAASRIGDAINDLRIKSGLVAARHGATAPVFQGQMDLARTQQAGLEADRRFADFEVEAIRPELRYIDRIAGATSDRTEGVVGASLNFEAGMNDLLTRQSMQRQPDTLIGDLLSIGGSGLRSYAGTGGSIGSFIPSNPFGSSVKPFVRPPGGAGTISALGAVMTRQFQGTLSSRGAPGATYRYRGIPSSPLAGVGEVVADLIAVGSYDPENDPNRQRANLLRVQADAEAAEAQRLAEAESRDSIIRHTLDSLQTPEEFQAYVPAMLGSELGRPDNERGIGDLAMVVANLMSGREITPDDAFMSAGGRPDQTRAAFDYNVDTQAAVDKRGQDVDAATDRRGQDVASQTDLDIARMEPEAGRNADGSPGFTTRGEIADGNAAGFQPILSESEVKGEMLGGLDLTDPEKKAAVGAEPKLDGRAPTNYQAPDGTQGITKDGVTDSTTGQPIPAGSQIVKREATGEGNAGAGLTDSQAGNLELEAVNFADFQALMNDARTIASGDPTIFGATGNVRRLAQAATQQMANIGLLAGGSETNLDSAYADAYASMANSGVDMSLFGAYDPNLNDITKLSTLLTYGAASVLAGQEGRSVSDRDVKQFQRVVGDPTSWLGSQRSFLAGLDMMERILAGRIQNRAPLRQGGSAPTVPSNVGQPVAPPAAGTVEDGWRFKGGDPGDQANWERVQ